MADHRIQEIEARQRFERAYANMDLTLFGSDATPVVYANERTQFMWRGFLRGWEESRANPSSPAPAEGSRAAFEAFAVEHGYATAMYEGSDTYIDPDTRIARHGYEAAWQAAQGERAGLTGREQHDVANIRLLTDTGQLVERATINVLLAIIDRLTGAKP